KRLLQSALEQRDGLRETAVQCVRVSQLGGEQDEHEAEIRGLAERVATFEYGDGVLEVSPAEVDVAESVIRARQAICVIPVFGDSDPLLTSGDALGKLSEFGQTPGPPGPSQYGGEASHAEAITDGGVAESRHPTKYVDGRAIVTDRIVGDPEIDIRGERQRRVNERGAEPEGTLAVVDRPRVVAHHPDAARHITECAPQSL